jgi:hypothetical protein
MDANLISGRLADIAQKFPLLRAEMLFTSDMPTHTHKKRALRALSASK